MPTRSGASEIRGRPVPGGSIGNRDGFLRAGGSVTVLKRILSWVRGPSVAPGDQEQPYTCIKCGETFDREVSACSACGNQFIARDEE